MICFYVQSIKLLKYQRELGGFTETSVNMKYQYFALFNKIHHIFDKSLHLPILGGEMYMLLMIDLGNKHQTVLWQQSDASGSFCLLDLGQYRRLHLTGREVHGTFQEEISVISPSMFPNDTIHQKL